MNAFIYFYCCGVAILAYSLRVLFRYYSTRWKATKNNGPLQLIYLEIRIPFKLDEKNVAVVR